MSFAKQFYGKELGFTAGGILGSKTRYLTHQETYAKESSGNTNQHVTANKYNNDKNTNPVHLDHHRS